MDWTDEAERERDELDARIDARLQRRFTPPAEIEFQPPGRGRGGALSGPMVALAAAGFALACGLAMWMSDDQVSTTVEVARAPSFLATPERPDLTHLYEEIINIQEPGNECRGGEISDGVEHTLASRCGSSIALEPDAADLLVGPFSSDEWPSGTVLAGYPDGPDEPPVVIVAECADYQSCCIDLFEGGAPGLQHFSAEHGGVTLTEITPHAEPRMLAMLTAAR